LQDVAVGFFVSVAAVYQQKNAFQVNSAAEVVDDEVPPFLFGLLGHFCVPISRQVGQDECVGDLEKVDEAKLIEWLKAAK